MTFIDKIVDFMRELFQSLDNGYLFFGGATDLIRAVCDILLVTVLIYLMLVFIKQSRAWQLMKGIVFVFVFVMVCSLLGLELVSFIFSNFLYVFAIMFVVIFQPELRRVLETVGIKSGNSIRGVISGSASSESKTRVSNFVHEICLACKEMSRTKTGALILIERNTRLDELLTQENVVKFESSVTNSVLQSLFYKGAPMHDGAVLIRNGTIIAARCHIPVSVTMHSLDTTGTRHRAAVGASEMGDTIAVAVSEERGTISVALNGVLYEMKDANQLEANLKYLLGISSFIEPGSLKKAFRFKSRKNKANAQVKPAAPNVVVAASEKTPPPEYSMQVKEDSEPNIIRTRSITSNVAEKVVLAVISLVLATGLWIYVQITNNPVVTRHYSVPITFDQEPVPGLRYSYDMTYVEFDIVGRQKVVDSLQSSDISAVLDFSEVTGDGVYNLPVVVSTRDSSLYFRVENQNPGTHSVAFYDPGEEKE